MKWLLKNDVTVSLSNRDDDEAMCWAPFDGLRVTFLFCILFALTGCASGEVTPTDIAPSSSPIIQKLPERQLTDDTYVALTAEVVCLSKTFPTATEAELNAKAAALFKTYRVSETAYDAYQAEVKKDATRSKSLSYQIVGQMEEACGGKVDIK